MTTFFLAPLAGYTDVPYRLACRAQGAYFLYTALIDSGALVYGNRENEFILKRSPLEPWLGVQLLGSIPEHVTKATDILETMDYETIDFNMGCPVSKVMKRPAGAALLQPANHDLAFRCVELIRAHTKKPFTCKIRVLDFEDPEPTVQFCKRLVDLGVEAITIHGRLAASIYSGPVATHVIRAVRESIPVPVTANGGVFSVEDARKLQDETGCERIMVARGSLGNPWIFRGLNAGKNLPPTTDELCNTLFEHVRGMVELYGPDAAFPLSRKIIVAYLRGRGFRKEFRVRGATMASWNDFTRLVEEMRAEGPVA